MFLEAKITKCYLKDLILNTRMLIFYFMMVCMQGKILKYLKSFIPVIL